MTQDNHDKYRANLNLTCASNIKPEKVKWLWPGRIALGKLTLIAGNPGLGKSLLTTTLAAHVTNNIALPVTGEICPQGEVLMFSAEDGLGDTIRPRLDAAQANPMKVFLLNDQEIDMNQNFFSLARDMGKLDCTLTSHPDCKLLTIDPISAYLGKIDSYKDAEVRPLFSQLGLLAQKHDISIVSIIHLNKGSSTAIHRIMGSVAISAAPRAAHLVTECKSDSNRRLFLPMKNNLGSDKEGYAYSITTADNDAPYIVWENEFDYTSAHSALDTDHNKQTSPKRDRAVNWLKDLLSNGPIPSTEVQRLAEEHGISKSMLERAKKNLSVSSEKNKNGKFSSNWVMRLPSDGEDIHESSCH